MEKRIITILLALALLFPLAAQRASAGDLLESKSVYYTEESDYMDGDCILTATRMMIKRAAIMRNADGWQDITNEKLRPEATADGLLLYSFSFDAGGVTYSISCGSFDGESSYERLGEFAGLLENHPEGIVVWGAEAASTGTHGVLLVKAGNRELYAMDPSFNKGPFSEEIQKWKDTTMLDPALVTDYWYISGISAENESADVGGLLDKQINTMHFDMIRQRLSFV